MSRHSSIPLILVTNDDGIASPGLRAAATAAMSLGELVIAAPDRQWSGAGRSMASNSSTTGRISRFPLEIDGQEVAAYQVDAPPALLMIHALFELTPRLPALVISGINYGENLGSDVTISGTIGAALQAAVHGIPALAVSLQSPKETHTRLSDRIDFAAAIHFTRLFASAMLVHPLPADVDILKVDIPSSATPQTPWRVTRASRQPYFVTLPPRRTNLEEPCCLDYAPLPSPDLAEADSDIYAVAIERIVSVTPLSLDLTSRASLESVEGALRS